jgi:hypothetical protein
MCVLIFLFFYVLIDNQHWLAGLMTTIPINVFAFAYYIDMKTWRQLRCFIWSRNRRIALGWGDVVGRGETKPSLPEILGVRQYIYE